jgi:prolycopene isomerase
MLDARLRDARLKAIVSAQWEYYGLPPSKLSCFYYALPFLGYLAHGGFYPRGRSQDISNALVKVITSRRGTVLVNTGVEKILMKEGAAIGVRTARGEEFTSKVVISNADPFETFLRLVGTPDVPQEYSARWRDFTPSLSCFQVFLGLKTDLVKRLGIPDSEIFLESSYDPEAGYACALSGDVEHGGCGVTLYDNIFSGYSPEGKNTLNLLTLQGYEPWERFEAEYRAGKKTEYRKAKERMADTLIQRAETLLPGLTAAIEVRDIGTPLTNVRYTGHHRGAIYGWDQTVNNSGSVRVGHETPIKNLYLAGAWSRPGHGYGAVIPSGLECFAEIMKHW